MSVFLWCSTAVQGQRVYTVTNTGESGDGSFYQAIRDANKDGVDSRIEFNLVADRFGVLQPIKLSSTLYTGNSCTENIDNKKLIIDGTTVPFFHTVFIENANPSIRNFTGLSINSSNVEVYGLQFRYFNTGIGIEYGLHNIDPCSGMSISNIQIGKASANGLNYGNILIQNTYGIKIQPEQNVSNVTIQNNVLGTDRSYSSNLANDEGIYIDVTSNYSLTNVLIGGNRDLGEGNVFAQAFYYGIETNKRLIVQGNYFGTDPTQSKNLGNRDAFADFNSNSQQYFENNVFAYSTSHGIFAPSASLSKNSFFCNPIPLFFINASTAPTITKAEPLLVKGTSIGAYGTISLYYDDKTNCSTAPCQGKTLIDTITADVNGNWAYVPTSALTSNRIITAISDGGRGIVPTNSSLFSDCATITCPTNLIDSISNINNVSCYGGSDGSATIAITPTGNYTYEWGANTPIYTTGTNLNLAAGSYRVRYIEVSSGCGYRSQLVTIGQPTAPLGINCSVIQNTTTLTSNDGKAQIVVTGGTSPYTLQYSLNNGTAQNGGSIASGSFNLTNLAAGNYSITVTDTKFNATATTTNKAGCTATCNFTIAPPSCAGLIATASQDSAVKCAGGSDGRYILKFDDKAANFPLTIRWSDRALTDSYPEYIPNLFYIRTGLKAGNYSMTLTDNAGCSVTASTTITEPTALAATSTSTNVTSLGGTNGTITLNLTGGTPNYTVVMRNAAGAIITQTSGTSPQYIYGSLLKGTYTYTITDSKGCSTTNSITITELSCTIATQVTNVTCNSLSNGSILATPTGGTSPYRFNWSNNATTQTISNLSAANYSVTVTDAVGCSASTSATITQPDSLSLSTNIQNVSLPNGQNGQIIVGIRGGTPPYQASSNNKAARSIDEKTVVFDSLKAGTYSYTVIDAKGCTKTGSVIITEPKCVMRITVTPTSVLCNGDATGKINTIVTNANGNVTYSWTGTTPIGNVQNPTNLLRGAYKVTATDVQGCKDSAIVAVTEPSKLTSSNTPINVTISGQNNGEIRIKITGGTQSYTLNLTLGIGSITSITPDSFVIKSLVKGDYRYVITDGHGCKDSATVRINDPNCTNLTVTVQTIPISCFGGHNGRIILTVTGATSTPIYTWDSTRLPKAAIVTDLLAGRYRVTVTDSIGCTISKTIEVSQPSLLVATESVSNITVPNGRDGRITVIIRGGTLSYQVTSNNLNATQRDSTTFVFENLKSGTYTYTVTDANGCQITKSNVEVTEPPCTATAKIQMVSPISCFNKNDGSLRVNTTNVTTPQYNWSNNFGTTNSLTNLGPGIYRVTVLDTNGCTTSDSITLPNPNEIVASILKSDAAICKGEIAQLHFTVTGASTFTIFFNGLSTTTKDAIVTPSSTTTYRIDSIRSGKCLGRILTDSVVVKLKGSAIVMRDTTLVLQGLSTSILVNTYALLQLNKDNPAQLNITAITKPLIGSVKIVNQSDILFNPEDFVGKQKVPIHYTVCSQTCPNVCTEGVFSIDVIIDTINLQIKIPKIMVAQDTRSLTMQIEGIDLYPNNEVVIFDRWGTLVFGPTVYQNDVPDHAWDGTRNGRRLPTGAYYCIVRDKNKKIFRPIRDIIYLIDGQ